MYEQIQDYIKSINDLQTLDVPDTERERYEKAGFSKLIKLSNVHNQRLDICFSTDEVMCTFKEDQGFLLDAQKDVDKLKRILSSYAIYGVKTERRKGIFGERVRYSLFDDSGKRIVRW